MVLHKGSEAAMTRVVSVCLLALIGAGAHSASAQEPPEKGGDSFIPKSAYGEFSKLVHKHVVPHVPKYCEDLSGWGGTIPLDPDVRLRLPKLRTYLKVGDHIEVPHGLWKKFRIWIEDPDRDVQIQVREVSKTEKGLRLTLEADVFLYGEAEVKPWQKGLGLPVVKADADIAINLQMDVDVKLTFDTKKFPPDVTIEPWIVSSKLDLRDLQLKKVGSIISFEGETVANWGNEMKGMLNGLLQRYEEQVTDRANQAIAESLKNGKGRLSTGELLKLFSSK
jgi:hypothetical protein